MPTITIPEIAHMLNIRKDANHSTVLFLGARAGALFRNLTFYGWIEKFSIGMSNFNRLTDLDKFSECYSVLNGLSEGNINDILIISLKSTKYRSEDICLAALVKAEYFDTIISTNADNLLERTFDHVELMESYDYHVYIAGRDSIEEAIQRKPRYCKICKVFGDFGARKYTTFNNKFNLDEVGSLKGFLESTLAKSVLVVGYDPIWDEPIERAFPQRGEDLWFVNEQPPVEHSLMAQAIQRRGGKYLEGPAGSYRRFIQSLHLRLLNTDPLSMETLSKIFDQLYEIQRDVSDLKQRLIKGDNHSTE